MSSGLTLIATIVGLTRFIGNKYAADQVKLEASLDQYIERTDKKLAVLEEAERKCMEEKSLLIGRVTTLEHIAKLRSDKDDRG